MGGRALELEGAARYPSETATCMDVTTCFLASSFVPFQSTVSASVILAIAKVNNDTIHSIKQDTTRCRRGPRGAAAFISAVLAAAWCVLEPAAARGHFHYVLLSL